MGWDQVEMAINANKNTKATAIQMFLIAFLATLFDLD